ncbi:MAG: hypothetical protein HY318_07810 [Armatimonadetes bacterium]|nr:hypothetical protein [Armatimonadota bacterium]
MKRLFPCLLILTLVRGAAANEVVQTRHARFTLSAQHANVVRAQSDVDLVAPCFDQYLWSDDNGEMRSSEQDDRVVAKKREGNALVFTCHNEKIGETIAKRYERTKEGEALAKTVTVGPLKRRGEFRVRSVVNLASSFREGALYYTPRQSWGAPPERDLFGVQPASKFTAEVISGSGWDNRFVAAFTSSPSAGMSSKPALALGHYRWAIRGQHVMPSAVTGAWGAQSAQALTYTPTGWHFELLHTLDGEKAPVSGTAHYLVTPGDFLDVWRNYRAMPEHRAWEQRPVPKWVTECKAGGFWHYTPGNDKPQIDDAHATAERLKKYVPLGVFAWCLDGDYETEKPFLNETGALILTPEYMKARVADFQSNPLVRLGLYFQGSVMDSLTSAFRHHPEWAIQTPEGKPFFSGFRDNAAGEMHFFNPLDEAWTAHYRRRMEAVLKVYNPGWIYCDGGAAIETTDYRMRRPILPDTWNDFYKRQQDLVHQSGPDRAVLLNAQCWPYADLYWLECGFFSAGSPWRQAVDFCFDTKILHTPERTVLPLYWSDHTRYLALCIAFGFTPCTSGKVGGWDDSTWRALDCAYAMRAARLILSSSAVSPVWWKDSTSVVCFAEKVGEVTVVPVLNFSDAEKVQLTIDCKKASVPPGAQAWIVHPFETGKDEALPLLRPAEGKLVFDLTVPRGFEGLRLLVLGKQNLL